LTALIGREDRSAIERLFRSSLTGEVRVALFTSKHSCLYCGQTRQLLEEIASLSDRIKLEVVDKDEEGARAAEMKVEFTPTVVVVASNGAKLHYVGMPGGRQLRSLVEDLVDASRGTSEMGERTRRAIRGVRTPTVIKVFVTPVCPYSPLVVRSAHKFALENPMIRALMVETVEFPDLAKKYDVVGVPRTVINDRVAFDGAPAEEAFAEKVLDASRQSSDCEPRT
jgi:glutaredoxin-like protein